MMRWTGLLATGWIVAYVVESVALPVFTGPPSYGLLFALFGIIAALSHPDIRPGSTIQAGRNPGAAKNLPLA